MGLHHPDSGEINVNGRRFVDSRYPLSEVGAHLEARSVDGARSAFNHLLALAYANGLPRSRVTEMLETVGLAGVGRKRVKGFSLGMAQRLGIAAALLGNPPILLFDEPMNGLDPEGIKWVRDLLKGLAAQGRTIFVSSHLMSEMAITADHIVVIGHGRLIADAPASELVSRQAARSVLVRSPRAPELAEALQRAGAVVNFGQDWSLTVSGMDAARVGEFAAEAGIVLHELSPQEGSLEEAYLELTAAASDYHGVLGG